MSSTESSNASELKARPQFNYQVPRKDQSGPKGRYVIMPNFDTKTGPTNQKLAVMKNSELPELLKVAGHLTGAEDDSICCHEFESDVPYYIASGPNDESPVFTAQYFGQKNIWDIKPVYAAMKEARKIALRRITDPKSESKLSEFEQRMSSTKTRKSGRRFYAQGFTITPQEDAISAAPLNSAIIKNAETHGKLNLLVAFAARYLLESCAPKEVLAYLSRQAEASVPLTFGDEGNRYFTTVQYNYSGENVISLEAEIGDVGALHIDSGDDVTRWTVLLSLSNIPKGYWPGRTFISSIRAYAAMGPMTALVFKAVHPHISLGPSSMGDSKRVPFVPFLPDEILIMDPKLYHYSRLAAVCYPKEAIMKGSPRLIRRSTPLILQKTTGLRSALPEAHPAAIAAFGTKRNQMEFLARLEAFDMAMNVRVNPNIIMPSANIFVDKWRWREDGKVKKPRAYRIHAVIAGLTDADTEWCRDYKVKCNSLLSMKMFTHKKVGTTRWVSAQEIGSTFADVDPSLQTIVKGQPKFNKKSPKTNCTAVIKQKFGDKPFECPSCEMRFSTKQKCKEHHIKYHGEDEEWQFPLPSVDPEHRPQSDSESDEGGEEDEPVEETGTDDEECTDREEEPFQRGQKRARYE